MLSPSDVIGPWSEVKLDILREYASPYSRIVAAHGFYHLYIDAYAAGGAHISRTTGAVVPGSPLIALSTEPAFREYHFIDADPTRVRQLRRRTANRSDVRVHSGDCNEILIRDVFPQSRYEDRRRALCLLDPYNIDLRWEVIATAGRMKSIEVFVNFMVMDMNMNVLLRDPTKAEPPQVARMDRFWGDRSWQDAAYEPSPQGSLFSDPDQVKVEDANEKVAEAYRRRLVDVAGFTYAPKPLRFVNSLGFTIYYLFFASPNNTGQKIVEAIFAKHREKQNI
ncbi:MAG: three-Cys-motif partner protein TcmP [Bryobacteraceae bacterium]